MLRSMRKKVRGDWVCRNRNMNVPSNAICLLLIRCLSVCLSVCLCLCPSVHTTVTYIYSVFYTKLIDDKKALSDKCERLVKEVKELDKKCSQKVKALEEK